MKRIILSLLAITFLIIGLESCDKENFVETAAEQQSPESYGLSIETVSIEESKIIFSELNSELSSSKSESIFSFDNESIGYQDIEGSNAKFVVMDAHTRFDNVESTVYQLKIDGVINTVVLNHINSKSSNNQGKIINAYSSRLVLTDVYGIVFEDKFIKNSKIISNSGYSSAGSDPTCPPSVCGIKLDEVIVTAPPSNTNVCAVCPNNSSDGFDGSFQDTATMLAFMAFRTSIINFNDRVDDSKLKPCMQKILLELNKIGTTPGFSYYLFTGEKPTKYNWRLTDGSLPASVNARTSSVLSNGYATTVFDSSKLTGASDLSIARTMMHENMHAFLTIELRTNRASFNMTYPEMLKEYTNTKSMNDLQHNEFVRSLIADFTRLLEGYGKSKGYKHSKQFYDDLAWGGLTGTNAFKLKSESDRRRISDTISIEQTGRDMNGNSRTQKGTKAGC